MGYFTSFCATKVRAAPEDRLKARAVEPEHTLPGRDNLTHAIRQMASFRGVRGFRLSAIAGSAIVAPGRERVCDLLA
jgi:hypothetical protein